MEKRLKAVEAELERLKAEIRAGRKPAANGWRHIVGSFKGDPLYAEAMRLGRKYRESQRPKSKGR